MSCPVCWPRLLPEFTSLMREASYEQGHRARAEHDGTVWMPGNPEAQEY
ncbi:hypothetical protein [Streptomyces sp. NPDC055036]